MTPQILATYKKASVAGAFNALLHFDGTNGSTTFIEETGKTVTRTGTIVALSTAWSAFGPSSCLFPGTAGNKLSLPITTPITGDFSWGCWIKQNSTAGTQGLMALSGINWELFTTGGSLRFYNGGVTGIVGATLTAGTPYFVCFERVGSTVSLASGIAGGICTVAGTTTQAGSLATGILSIGSYTSTSDPFNGYIDEAFLWTGGTLYGGASFPVPASPYTYP